MNMYCAVIQKIKNAKHCRCIKNHSAFKSMTGELYSNHEAVKIHTSRQEYWRGGGAILSFPRRGGLRTLRASHSISQCTYLYLKLVSVRGESYLETAYKLTSKKTVRGIIENVKTIWKCSCRNSNNLLLTVDWQLQWPQQTASHYL